MTTALHAVCLLLGGRMIGLSLPGGARVLLAAAASAVASIALILLRLSWAALATLPAATLLCYGNQGKAGGCRACVAALLASFLVGGCGLCAQRATGLGALPPLAAAALGAGALPLIRLTGSCMGVRQLELRVGERQVLLPAMTDTGNLLRDPLTGDPVIVISARAAKPLFPEAKALGDASRLPPGFRLLSVKTAAGSALLPMFRPTECLFYQSERRRSVRALVAIAPNEYRGVQALVPASLQAR